MREAIRLYNSCRVMSESLTDGSLAFSVEASNVSFECVNLDHAVRLAEDIDLCSDVVTL